MLIKYRVHEVAKDFDKDNNEIIALLEKYGEGEKKHMTVLEENELDIVFETFTQKEQVKNFDEYFAMANEVKVKPKKKAPVKKEEKVAAKPKQEKKGKVATKETKKAPVPTKVHKSEVQVKQGKAAPASKEARRVDTRGGRQVNLDKYDERYEQIAPENLTPKQTDRQSTQKQKFRQRTQKTSNQFRRQGMRSRKRETEAQRKERIARERAEMHLEIEIPDEITVGALASKLKLTAAEVIKKLFSFGVMASVNETLDFETAEIVATELGATVKKEIVVTIEDKIIDVSEDKEEDLQQRDPVVVVMGHVDHGKTSLLDAIRDTSVTEGEAGGITQHIGASRVAVGDKMITFLDTPGHAAFTSMRARGAQATDIAVLVVAADDGIMPQTIEAINHARAAEVEIIVAINKIDKPEANPDRIMQQLTEHGLIPEEWGGETICVPVSAKVGTNMDTLLETILLVAEMKELRANPNRAAEGIVIEARLDKGRGAIATLLVQNGTLHAGDTVIAGSSVGRVRVMLDDRGKEIDAAGPSIPTEITGLSEVPQAGDVFNAVKDEGLAKRLVEQRKAEVKEEEFQAFKKVTLDNLFSSIKDGEMKDLNIIVKADVQGSAEALKQNLQELSNEEVRVNVIHNGVGAISESDVNLANASNAIIIGFDVRPDAVANEIAEREGVDIRTYRVIYDAIEEVEAAIKGMLAPKYREVMLGTAEVRDVMKLSSFGIIAGSYVTDGVIERGASVRIVRDGTIVADDKIASLRRFKDDVKEVKQGYECGIALENFMDIKNGDIFEVYKLEEYKD